jgi:hypothetical protein
MKKRIETEEKEIERIVVLKKVKGMEQQMNKCL